MTLEYWSVTSKTCSQKSSPKDTNKANGNEQLLCDWQIKQLFWKGTPKQMCIALEGGVAPYMQGTPLICPFSEVAASKSKMLRRTAVSGHGQMKVH